MSAKRAVAQYDDIGECWRAVGQPDGRVSITFNGTPFDTATWDGATIQSARLPSQLRLELSRRFAKSASATGTRLLYHYRPVAGVRGGEPVINELGPIVANDCVWFSDPRGFHENDSEELKIRIDFDMNAADREVFLRKHFGRRAPEDLIQTWLRTDYLRETPYFAEKMTEHLQQQAYRAGVMCFFPSGDDEAMWDQYGHEHTGVCLEFGFPSGLAGPLALMPVEYVDARPTVHCTADLAEIVRGTFTTKTTEYATEQEWRAIHIPRDDEEHGHGWTRLTEPALRGIILGRHIDPQHERAIRQLVRETGAQIEIRKAASRRTATAGTH